MSKNDKIFSIENDELRVSNVSIVFETYEKAFLGFTSTSNDVFEINNRENADMTFHTNTTERLRISSGGKVGVGTTTMHQFFNIKSDSTSQSLINIATYDSSRTLNVGVVSSAG